jgi:hypothetical protein
LKIKSPQTDLGKFWFYFLIQFVTYGIVVANGRAYVQGSYLWTAVTDTFFAAMQFIVMRVIMKDVQSSDELHGLSMLGYVVGGTAGSLFAIWVTKILYGQ